MFLKSFFKEKDKKYLVVKRKKTVTIVGEVFNLFLKETPKDSEFKKRTYTFWERVILDNEYSVPVCLYSGNRDYSSFRNITEYDLCHAVKYGPCKSLHGLTSIEDDFGGIVPVSNIALIEPTEEKSESTIDVYEVIVIKKEQLISTDEIL